MGSAHLGSEAWVIIGLIAGLAVLLCLSVIASVLEYERGLRKLSREVRAIKDPLGAGRRAAPRKAA